MGGEKQIFHKHWRIMMMTSWVPLCQWGWSIFCVARCDALRKSQLSTKRQTGAITPVFLHRLCEAIIKLPATEVGPSCFTVKHQKVPSFSFSALKSKSEIEWECEGEKRSEKLCHIYSPRLNLGFPHFYPPVYWIIKIVKDTRLGQRQYMWR